MPRIAPIIEPGVCPVIFKSGQKAGQICGAATKNGLPVCGRHKKEEIAAAVINKLEAQKKKSKEELDEIREGLSQVEKEKKLPEKYKKRERKSYAGRACTLPIRNREVSCFECNVRANCRIWQHFRLVLDGAEFAERFTQKHLARGLGVICPFFAEEEDKIDY